MIQAYGSNIVVKINEVSSSGGKTKGGLYIPEVSSAANGVVDAEVVSVGPLVGIGMYNGHIASIPTVVGDTVWFQKPNATPLIFEGMEYYVIADNAVLAVEHK